MRRFLILVAAFILLASPALSIEYYSPVKNFFRGAQTSGALAVSQAAGAITHTFNNFGASSSNTADYFEVYYRVTAGTNPLHVQVFKADGDSTFVAPSSIFLVYPDEIVPFPVKGVDELKLGLTTAGESGTVIVTYYKE